MNTRASISWNTGGSSASVFSAKEKTHPVVFLVVPYSFLCFLFYSHQLLLTESFFWCKYMVRSLLTSYSLPFKVVFAMLGLESPVHARQALQHWAYFLFFISKYWLYKPIFHLSVECSLLLISLSKLSLFYFHVVIKYLESTCKKKHIIIVLMTGLFHLTWWYLVWSIFLQWHNFVLLYSWIIFYCVNILYLLYSFICW